MSKLLSEQKVLKKLDIEDFRHLTKDKVIVMASMLDRMEPEVAKKALEQFPEFSNTAKVIVADLKETLDKTLEANGDSVKSFYASGNRIIDILENELKNEDLSFEDKRIIIDKMMEVHKMANAKDTENKKFLLSIAAITTVVGGLVVASLASTIGGNTKIDFDDTNQL